MQIWILRSIIQRMLRHALVATAHSAAGKWSVMSGNGRPPTSPRSQDLHPTPTKIIRSHGLGNEKCCAADAGRRAHGLPGRATGISSLLIAMTSFPGSGLAPFSVFGRMFPEVTPMRILAPVKRRRVKRAPRCQPDIIIPIRLADPAGHE